MTKTQKQKIAEKSSNKKILYSILLVTLITLTVLTVYYVFFFHTPASIRVHASIQEAINRASEGDTIFVPSGIYNERLVVDKTVSLVGEDVDTTIIDGKGSNTVISITADNINIRGFTIRGNREEANQTGISIAYSNDNIISHNIIRDNSFGIRIIQSENNIVSDNNVFSNNWGIFLMSKSNYTTVIRNNVSSIYSCIWCEWSNNNVLTGNTIRQGSQYGIWLRSSNGSRIFRNNFIDNAHQAGILDSTNLWDYESEGNYWSDYSGVDIDGDGIGDSSYIIDVDNVDNNPLIGFFSDLEADGHRIHTVSNSTIYHFNFNQTTHTISFNVHGQEGSGFCRITIPHALGVAPYTILVDSHEHSNWAALHSNPDNTTLCLKYQHSEHEVTIIMEYQPTGILLPSVLLMVIALILVVAIAFLITVYHRTRKTHDVAKHT